MIELQRIAESQYLVPALFGIVVLLFAWNLVLFYRLKRHIARVGSTRPVETTPDLIKYWRRRMNEYQPGSRKYAAYRKRLIDAGELDGS